ncbi:MAG TPA: type II toxin-antitoxin system RelE/ParE family toxin [Syntrophobacteraceae bacterium]|mgnify:FL=1|nr:type II toxin-antitoxin system RelE/ParE family toxin [Caldisericia bacterium]HQN17999.1 type II toxin-antitoxin system RelE/ParE family toxin [Syntrophobacteraceae bacterium]
MEYTVKIVHKAEKEFLKLTKAERNKISKKILSLAENPKPFGSQKLKETDYFRIRIGDYRAIYSVDNDRKEVKVLSIAHRKDVYR